MNTTATTRLLTLLFLCAFSAAACNDEPALRRPPRTAAGGGANGAQSQKPVISSSLPGIRFVPQIGHSSSVRQAAMSADSTQAITAAHDGTIKIWDLRSERLVRTIGRAGSDVDAVAISADGKTGFSAGTDGVELLREIVAREGQGAITIHAPNHFGITMWDLSSGASKGTIPGHVGNVVALSAIADGRLFSASADRTLRAWDPKTKKETARITHPTGIRSFAVAPKTGKVVLTLGDDRVARIFGMDGQPPPGSSPPIPEATSIAFSTDGTRYAIGDAHGTVRVFDGNSHAPAGTITIAAAAQQPAAAPKPKPTTTGKLPAPATASGGITAIGFTAPIDIAIFSSEGGSGVYEVSSGKLVRPLGAGTPSTATNRKANTITAVTSTSLSPTLLAGTEAGSLELWDTSFGQIRRVFEPQEDRVNALSLTNTGLLATSRTHGVALWDLTTMHRARIIAPDEAIRTASASPDGRLIVTQGSKGTILRSTDTGETIQILATTGTGPVAFSSDGERIVGPSSTPGMIGVWDRRGAIVTQLSQAPSDPTSIAFSSDGTMIAAGGARGSVVSWNAKTGQMAGNASVGTGAIHALRWRAQGVVSAFGEDGPMAALYTVDLRKAQSTLVGHQNARPSAATFSADGQYLFVGAPDGPVFVFESSTGATVTRLDGHVRPVRGLAYIQSRRLLIAGAEDGTVKIFSLGQMAPMTMLSQGDEWLTYSTDGYFDSSHAGAELVAMVSPTSVFGVDQFAFMNNRPDVLIRRVGLGNDEIAAYFERRHTRRLTRAGLTEAKITDLHVPEARIVDVHQEGANGKTVTVKARFTDKVLNLKKWNVYVNGVQASKEREIGGHDASVDTTLELVDGSNTIEVSAVNERGAESFRARQVVSFVNPAGTKAKANLFFVGFGVSKYADARLNLEYAHKDAQDLAHAFKLPRTEYGSVTAKVFTDAEVNAKSLDEARALLASAKVDDTVVMFIAGHGVHARDADATYYYVIHNTDVKRLKDTALTFESIEELFHDIAPRRKLLLMDTCESGDAEEVMPAPAMAATKARSRSVRGLVLEAAAAAAPAPAAEAPPTAKASEAAPKKRAFTLQRDRFIFSDVTRRSGTVVFSSSQGNESSYESDDVKNGFFTRALLDAITTRAADSDGNGMLTKSEIRSFVSSSVATRSEQKQHPTIDRDNLFQSLELSVVGGK